MGHSGCPKARKIIEGDLNWPSIIFLFFINGVLLQSKQYHMVVCVLLKHHREHNLIKKVATRWIDGSFWYFPSIHLAPNLHFKQVSQSGCLVFSIRANRRWSSNVATKGLKLVLGRVLHGVLDFFFIVSCVLDRRGKSG